jgi:hypothetical protein
MEGLDINQQALIAINNLRPAQKRGPIVKQEEPQAAFGGAFGVKLKPRGGVKNTDAAAKPLEKGNDVVTSSVSSGVKK